MKVLDWTETFGIYSKLILASVVPSIVPISHMLAIPYQLVRKPSYLACKRQVRRPLKDPALHQPTEGEISVYGLTVF